jgi:hypothetical protein
MEILIYEAEANKVIIRNPNMLIPYYLMASYAYYVEDEPIFSDAYFDELAKLILGSWDYLEHRHKDFLNKDMLAAGSYSGEYPAIVKGSLKSFKNEIYSRDNSQKWR